MNIQFENFFTLENFISHNEKINLLMQTKDSSILNTTRKELEDLFNKPVLNLLKSLRDQKILKTIKFSDTHTTNISEAWNKLLSHQPLNSTEEYRLSMLFDKMLLNSSINFNKEDETRDYYERKYSELIKKINAGTFMNHEVQLDQCECYDCGQRMQMFFKEWDCAFGTFEVKPEGGLNYRKILPPKSCIEKNNIKLDLNFPTGEIIISDMIRIADFQKLIEYNGEDKYNSEKSLASSAGKIFLTKHFAKEHNMAYLSLSNSSPNIFQYKDQLLFGYIPEKKQNNSTDYKQIGNICTDFLGANIIDKKTLIDILAKKYGEEESIKMVAHYLKEDTNHQFIYINPGQ